MQPDDPFMQFQVKCLDDNETFTVYGNPETSS